MTVGELKVALSKLDDDLEVLTRNSSSSLIPSSKLEKWKVYLGCSDSISMKKQHDSKKWQRVYILR